MFVKEIYLKRREQIKHDVKSGIIILPGNPEASSNYAANTYAFRQDSNFLYFFGLNHADYVGVIDIDNNKDYIFANDMDMDDIIWMGALPTIPELASSVGISNTDNLSGLTKFVKDAISKGRKVHYTAPYRAEVSLQMSNLLGVNISELKQKQSEELIKAIVKQRSIKSDIEIVEIEKAMETAYKMHTDAMRMILPGMYEYQVAGHMEGIAISGGGNVSFPIIFSMNGERLHNHDRSFKLTDGRLVVVDAGAETAMNYCSDITRTTPVGGKYNQRQKEVYQSVLNANKIAIKNIKPGIPYKDMHILACKTLAEGLKEIGLMRGNIDDAIMQGAHAIFMPHGLGHMMGLDVHDMENLGEMFVGYSEEIERSKQFGLAFLRMGRKLESGFVITVEPGCYFIPALIDQWKNEKKFTEYINYDLLETYKDFGGIRIEDDVLVTDNGCKVLGKPIPKEIKDVEAMF